MTTSDDTSTLATEAVAKQAADELAAHAIKLQATQDTQGAVDQRAATAAGSTAGSRPSHHSTSSKPSCHLCRVLYCPTHCHRTAAGH